MSTQRARTEWLMTLALALGGCTAAREGGPALSAWDRARFDVALQFADEHIVAGEFDRARRALVPYARVPDVRLASALARIDVEEGRYAEALRRLDELPAADAQAGPRAKRPAAFHHLRGVALEALGRWEQAATAYEQGYDSEPSASRLVAWLDALVSAGRVAYAATVLERERNRFPGHESVHLFAARLSERAGQPDAAIEDLKTAALARPDSAEIQRRLAEAYARAERYGEAVATWEQLVSGAADDKYRRRYRHRLATDLLAAERVDEARRVYRVLWLTDPGDRQAAVGLAVTSLAAGEPAEALQLTLAVLDAHPQDADARLIAAVSYAQLDEPAKAAEVLADLDADEDANRLKQALLTRWTQPLGPR